MRVLGVVLMLTGCAFDLSAIQLSSDAGAEDSSPWIPDAEADSGEDAGTDGGTEDGGSRDADFELDAGSDSGLDEDAGHDAGRDAGRPVDAGRDGGPSDSGSDAGCVAPLTMCAGACVDTRSNPNHCGMCNWVCGTSICITGACVF